HGTLLEADWITEADLSGKDKDEVKELILTKTKEKYDQKEEEFTPERMREFEKVIVLRTVDTKWMDHIDQMEQLRQGIHLRAYGQNDPLREYQLEGFEMFEAMVDSINEDVSKYIMKSQIRENLKREAVVKNTQAVAGGEEAKKKV